MRFWQSVQPDIVVIEDYAYSRHSRALTPLHELGGVIRNRFLKDDVLWVPVPSTTLKMFATGSGRASKTQMVAAARKLWKNCKTEDEADAFHAAHWGLVNFTNLIEAS